MGESTVRVTKEWVQDRVLVLLDHNPSYGYELIQHLESEGGNIRLNTLYRWLNEMESKNLVKSEIGSGPMGPKRKIYSLTTRGKKRTTKVLRDSISLVLRAYCNFRKHAYPADITPILENDPTEIEGRILYVAYPKIYDFDIKMLEALSRRRGGLPIDVLSGIDVLNEREIRHRQLKGDPWDIPSPDERFTEIWLSGLLEKKMLRGSIQECKRVLKKRGILKIVAPYVSQEKNQAPSVGEFMLVTAATLFPELGVFEHTELNIMIEEFFREYSSYEIYPDMIVYWAKK
ncbi:MAG: helix-turn-helix transcriptional regulator [Candidatus Thorarchaeota archaeon]|jgi:PadR family transcriptional regulator PadR